MDPGDRDCCAVAYFSRNALLLRFQSGCKCFDIGTLKINDDYILEMWVRVVFGPLYGGIAFRLCGWHLSISSGPYAQSFAEFNPFLQVQSTPGIVISVIVISAL
jgi:hypothetical protein